MKLIEQEKLLIKLGDEQNISLLLGFVLGLPCLNMFSSS